MVRQQAHGQAGKRSQQYRRGYQQSCLAGTEMIDIAEPRRECADQAPRREANREGNVHLLEAS